MVKIWIVQCDTKLEEQAEALSEETGRTTSYKEKNTEKAMWPIRCTPLFFFLSRRKTERKEKALLV